MAGRSMPPRAQVGGMAMSNLFDTQPGPSLEREPPAEGADVAFQRLRQRYVEGRITLAEFEESVGGVYSPLGSQGDRDRIHEHGSPLGPTVRPLTPAGASHRAGAEVRAHVRSYVLVMVMLVGIWAMTGMGYFWPIWPMMGWGIGVTSHVLGAGNGCGSHGRHRGRHPRLQDRG